MSANFSCPLVGCTWNVRPGQENVVNHMELVAHLNMAHGLKGQVLFEKFDPKTKGYKVENGVPIGIMAEVELELDKYIKTAMEWPQRDGGPWDSNEIARLRDELEKAKATTIGRGLAIALWYMHGGNSVSNKFRSPDAVIRDAAERYKEQKAAEAAAAAQPEPQPTPTPAPQTGGQLTEEQRARISEAIEGGFTDLPQLAKMFKVPVAAIEALAR